MDITLKDTAGTAEGIDPKDGSALVKVMPTLFVGCGGTGKEVLMRLRRRIVQHDWNGRRLATVSEFPAAEFLYFDMDQAQAVANNQSVSQDPLFTAIRFTDTEAIQPHVDVADVIRNINRYPHIKRWFPTGSDFGHVDFTTGAGQIRMVSRLAFFETFRTLKNAASSKGTTVRANVTNHVRLKELGLDTTQDLRVVVVSSCAGGMGSGCFIDMGLMLRSMQPKPKRVELFLTLPTGHRSHNHQRVYANGFASLMELEHVMRPNPVPKHAERWSDFDQALETKPFDELYLVDIANMQGQRTAELGDVYDMIADILFEDFGGSEFAQVKRGTSVNLAQFKLTDYFPPMGEELGRAFSYSRAYSGCGYSSIQTRASARWQHDIYSVSIDMTRTFFGLAGERGEGSIRQQDVDALKDRLHLKRTSFQQWPDGWDDRQAIDLALVDQLLMMEGEADSMASVKSAAAQALSEIRSAEPNHKRWPELVRQAAQQIIREVSGDGGSERGRRGKEVERQRERLLGAWTAPDGDRSLRRQLFSYLDDPKRGIRFVMALVEDLTREIEGPDGALETLKQAEEAYNKLANEAETERYLRQHAHLRQTESDTLGFLSRKKDAEMVMDHLGDEIAHVAIFRLREFACREAARLLTSLVDHLGRKVGVSNGQPEWNGLVGEIQEGKKRIEQVIDMMDEDRKRFEAQLSRPSHANFLVVEDQSFKVVQPASDEVRTWAEKVFRAYGGSAKVFAVLEKPSARTRLFNEVVGWAKEAMADLTWPERKISREKAAEEGEADVDTGPALPSVMDALKGLSSTRRREIFERAARLALPWLNLDTAPMQSAWSASQVKLIVGIPCAEAEFPADYKTYIKDVTGADTVTYRRLGLRDRIVFYAEVAGVPLDAIREMRQFREEYLKEKAKPDALPLHSYRDTLRLPNPVVPRQDEIEQRRATAKLFLLGALTGVLRRCPGPMDASYEVQIENGDMEGVGTERKILELGFSPAHEETVREKVATAERALTLKQQLALAALFHWTHAVAYAPPREENQETKAFSRRPRFVSGEARKIADERLAAYAKHARIDLKQAQDQRDRLIKAIASWTVVIPDSLNDLDMRDLANDDELRPEDKRRLKDGLSDGEIEAILGAPAATPVVAAPIPMASGRTYKVWNKPAGAAKGTQLGPFDLSEVITMIKAGQIRADTKLAPMDRREWVEARTLAELSGHLGPDLPDPDDELEDPE